MDTCTTREGVRLIEKVGLGGKAGVRFLGERRGVLGELGVDEDAGDECEDVASRARVYDFRWVNGGSRGGE